MYGEWSIEGFALRTSEPSGWLTKEVTVWAPCIRSMQVAFQRSTKSLVVAVSATAERYRLPDHSATAKQ